MSQEIHYLETGSQDPFYNLAFEETAAAAPGAAPP